MFDNLRKFAAAYAVAIGGILRSRLSLWNVRQELQTSHYYLSVHPPAGQVTLVAPTGTRLEVARAYAVTRLGWIRRQQAKLQAQPRETPRQYIERESHYPHEDEVGRLQPPDRPHSPEYRVGQEAQRPA